MQILRQCQYVCDKLNILGHTFVLVNYNGTTFPRSVLTSTLEEALQTKNALREDQRGDIVGLSE
jgi:hypothetical protein